MHIFENALYKILFFYYFKWLIFLKSITNILIVIKKWHLFSAQIKFNNLTNTGLDV